MIASVSLFDMSAPVVVVMGVSGCGKTTIGRALAVRLGWRFRDGDEFHSPANIKKMRIGKPLDDADRAPWLAAIARWMDARSREGVPAVVACSALKRRYRDFLRDQRPNVWFLYLRVPRSELKRRLQTRDHPYMPASLLESQLRGLEEPDSREPRTIAVDAAGDVKAVMESALRELRAHGLPRTSMPNGGCGST
ncbi:MAG: gluconokinase [Rhodanobacteraceae bacterium]